MAAHWTDPYLLTAGANIAVTAITSKVNNSINSSSKKLQYSPRVRKRAIEDPVGHNFPYSFDELILKTKPEIRPGNYKIYRYPGIVDGKKGYYEIGVNNQGVIDHRVFKKTK